MRIIKENEKENSETSHSAEKKICFALMMSFVILTMQYFILIIFNLIDSKNGSIIQLVSKGLVGVTYLYAFSSVVRRVGKRIIFVYLISITVFLSQYLIFVENREYITDLLFPFFFVCLPAFIYASSVRNVELLKDAMRKTGYLVLFIGGLLGCLIFLGKADVGTYSMTLSYYVLFPAIIFSDELLSFFSIKSFIFTIFSIFVILTYGARGPLLCILGFIIIKLLRSAMNLTRVKAILYIFLGISTVLLYSFLGEILLSLNSILVSIGVNSRSLYLLMQSETHWSGRDFIYQVMLKEIKSSPVYGIGIAGDRRIIGGYSHNIIIELASDFGLLIGGLIIIFLAITIIRAMIVKRKNYADMISMWVALGFIHLMVSSSYLSDINFWILIGLLSGQIIGKEKDLPKTTKRGNQDVDVA